MLWEMGRYGSPLAMDEEVVGDYKIGEWADGWTRKIRTKGERYEGERERGGEGGEGVGGGGGGDNGMIIRSRRSLCWLLWAGLAV